MENLLHEYIEKTFRDMEHAQPALTGPVVTLSREYGCPSKLIAQALTDHLNHRSDAAKTGRWRFINKEIVESAARELELKPVEMNYLLSSGGKGVLEDIMASFSPLYVSDHRIRKTITKVVNDIAHKGNIVIVGRGGVGVLHGRPATLHVRLTAPIEWRIPQICLLRNVSEHEAVKLAQETDKKRTALIELLSGRKFSSYLFDLTFNCQTMTMDEIVDTIAGAMRAKKMLTV
jgi:cytidylate kinase